MESTSLPGESSVGKTSLVLRFDNRGFNAKFTTTIGVDYSDRMIAIEGKQIKLQIWDTAGQERFHSLTTSFFKRAEGFALVFDVNDRQSFDSISRWMRDIKEQGKPNSDIVLVGNKCDIKHRVVSAQEAKNLAAQFSVPYFETSAKENINVEQVFETLALSIKHRIDGMPNGTFEKKESAVSLVKHDEETKKSTCC